MIIIDGSIVDTAAMIHLHPMSDTMIMKLGFDA